MSANPWPDNDNSPLLLILDAAHRPEQQHLENWLERERQKSSYAGDVTRVILPIADSPERILAETLLPICDLPDETIVAPVRVVWLKGLDVKSTTPRFRDLVFGNPRRPGPVRARRLLKKHPMRAKCISARARDAGGNPAAPATSAGCRTGARSGR